MVPICLLIVLSLFLYVEGHLTGKNDVYGFGVVMLELLSGRRALDINRPLWEHNLVDWAKPYLASERKVVKNFDAGMKGQYSVSVARKAAKLANQCLSADPKFRPNMNEVVKALEKLHECSDIQGSSILLVPIQALPNLAHAGKVGSASGHLLPSAHKIVMHSFIIKFIDSKEN
jgi:serine/threonine protein kinase